MNFSFANDGEKDGVEDGDGRCFSCEDEAVDVSDGVDLKLWEARFKRRAMFFRRGSKERHLMPDDDDVEEEGWADVEANGSPFAAWALWKPAEFKNSCWRADDRDCDRYRRNICALEFVGLDDVKDGVDVVVADSVVVEVVFVMVVEGLLTGGSGVPACSSGVQLERLAPDVGSMVLFKSRENGAWINPVQP